MIHEIAEKFMMRSNGYAMFHDENFHNNPDLPCYIPENAEDKHDIYSRNDITEVVREFFSRDSTKYNLLIAYGSEEEMPVIDEKFIEAQTECVYTELSWEHPSTFLENLFQ
jgi:hypothetical protein